MNTKQTNNSEAYFKQQVLQYRVAKGFGLIRALGFTLVGIVGLALAANGSLFNTANGATPRGWLYENLGKDGAMIASVAIMALITLIGLIWLFRSIRGLTSGYKKYAEQLRQDIERGIQYR